MSKLSQQLEKACAAQPQFRIAFEDLRNATITISQGGKGKPNELKAEWTCTEQKSGMPTTRRWEETTAPDAPLPTPGDLTKMAKQMSDICGFRMQEASARY